MAGRPSKPPRSPFNRRSTAEEVTAGIDLTGKTALITGCNSGLGLETMRVLAMRGAHVIGAARTKDKAADACAGVKGKTTPVACELSDFNSVVACAEQVKQLDTPIDMLICNAGIMALPKLEQKYGLELQFVTNHLGHFILVNRLLPKVLDAESGRIVMLSSSAHAQAPSGGIQFDNLSGEDGYSAWSAYGQSKLANALFALDLSERLKDTPVTANSLHPGVIQTNLGRNMSGLFSMAIGLLLMPIMRTIHQGAATQCYVATNPDLSGVSGLYFSDCNPETPSKYARDKKLARKLTEVSEELVGQYLS